ncbi:GAF and ANTAR domain-containing protein [Kutzneria buriramensis]|uniref:GAF domain-containing protein n=1 Tax=Kutzneria buriramensis TaxID=1045776 RepID=A0A3E0HCZ8_9PSEU|nr:GAF and ANTAR domain-containing protein [Kutzneria buriramensis]REH42718.1 GAF domain-containing protein [Kutzneria buriramensis]
MHRDRYAAIAAAIGRQAAAEGVSVGIRHICRACAHVVGVDGVSFCTAGDLGEAEPIYATGVVGERAVELELTVGRGPGVQALLTGEEVLVGDLTRHDCRERWPVLVSLLAPLGVQAVFALPLIMGEVAVGVLELYRIGPQPLSADALADGRVFADYALAALLGGVVDESSGHDLDGVLAGSLAQQWVRVHQAVGVVSAQLGTGLTPAYQRLRAHAFVTDRPLREVADMVLEGWLRFTR